MDKGTILIVDNSPNDLLHLDRMLKTQGFSTIAAPTGQEVLKRIESDCPHLALLEIMLPDMSGDEVCRLIRQTFLTALLPIIMVSAVDEDRIAGIETENDDFLVWRAPVKSRTQSIFKSLALKFYVSCEELPILTLYSPPEHRHRPSTIS